MRRIIADVLFRMRALFGTRAQRELDDELRFHLEMDAATLRARGMPAADAERLARRQFGSLRREAEQVRDAWGVSLANEFVADVRHALRQMRRRAGYTAIILLTLGLGIGATVALFSVVSDLASSSTWRRFRPTVRRTGLTPTAPMARGCCRSWSPRPPCSMSSAPGRCSAARSTPRKTGRARRR